MSMRCVSAESVPIAGDFRGVCDANIAPPSLRVTRPECCTGRSDRTPLSGHWWQSLSHLQIGKYVAICDSRNSALLCCGTYFLGATLIRGGVQSVEMSRIHAAPAISARAWYEHCGMATNKKSAIAALSKVRSASCL